MKFVFSVVALSSLLCVTSCGPSIYLVKPVPSEANIRTGDSVAVIASDSYNPYAQGVESAIEKRIINDGILQLVNDPSRSNFVVEIKNAYIDKKGEYRTDTTLCKDFNLVTDVKVVSNQSGAVPFLRTYRPSFSKRKTWHKDGDVSYYEDPIPYNSVASNFVKSITPHNEGYSVSITANKENPLVQQSAALANRGNWGEASKLAKQALTVNPQESEAYFIIAICQREQGDFNAALNSFNQAIVINPKSKYSLELDRTKKIRYNHQFM